MLGWPHPSDPPVHSDCSRPDLPMQIRLPPLSTFRWQMFVLSLALSWAVGGLPEPAQAQPRPQIAKCVPGQARTADEYCPHILQVSR